MMTHEEHRNRRRGGAASWLTATKDEWIERKRRREIVAR
jgi:hypothetical protein